MLAGFHAHAQKRGRQPLSPYFSAATTKTMTPDEQQGSSAAGCCWNLSTNPTVAIRVFTDSYIREAFTTEYFSGQFSLIPKHGDKVKVGKQKLAWHAVESNLFNAKLFRFCHQPAKAVLRRIVLGGHRGELSGRN